MRTHLAILLAGAIAGAALAAAGCSRDEPPPPAASPVSAPPPGDGATAAAPPAEPAELDAMPEDRVLDAALEAPIRARAAELGAVTPRAVGQLKVGDEAIVLVRGVTGGRGYASIYGSGPYTLDSGLRPACIHAGILQNQELGLVRVRVIRHDGKHPAEPRHGIRPHAWGEYHASYTIEKIELQ